MNVLVLLSGGIDSSCCVAFYRQAGHAVTGVFVDYGQPVSQQEERSARAIGRHYTIPLHVIRSSGTYYDCSEHFVDHLNGLLSGYCDGQAVLATPFLTWSKQAVYDFCLKSGIPAELTWSCEVGPLVPCGRCLSCEDRLPIPHQLRESCCLQEVQLLAE